MRYGVVTAVGVVTWCALHAMAILDPTALWARGATSALLSLVAWPLLAGALHQAHGRFGGATPKVLSLEIPWVAGGAALALGLAHALWLVGAIGGALLTAVAVLHTIAFVRAKPPASLVTADDPLTKGDDACFQHIAFAHRFLPLATLSWTVAALLVQSPWGWRFLLAGTHLFAIGYVLLALYALGHLWIPRFSGVPAIAAGAIKGELHSTLLGLTGLTIGFLTGIRGIMSGLGFFVFVGTFTYMGVLGANMMRRKSQTHRVTPEFVYIPWTFTGIFWLISAVLMGLFLNAVPDVLADRAPALVQAHLAAGLLGGAAQLWMGWQTRQIAPPPRFQGLLRAQFFLWNIGVGLFIWGGFAGAQVAAGALVVLTLALLAFVPLLVKLLAQSPMESR